MKKRNCWRIDLNDIEYFYDVKNGIVVAKLSNIRYRVRRGIIQSGFACGGPLSEVIQRVIESTPIVYTAKATVDPRDEFDAEFGRKLAQKRLLAKVNRAYSRAVASVVDALTDMLDESTETEDWLSEKAYLYNEDCDDMIASLDWKKENTEN